MMNPIGALFQKKLVQNSLWLFVLQIANTVLPLLTVPYVTRVLGTAGYGAFSLAYNWITYAQVVVEYGFAMSGARSVALDPNNREKVSKIFSGILMARMVLFAAVVAVMAGVCVVQGVPGSQVKNVFILMAIVLSVVFQMNWIYQGMQQMKFITIVNVLGRLTSVVMVFALVRQQTQVALYCFCYSVTFLFSGFVGFVLAIRKYGLRFRFPGVHGIVQELKNGWHLFASSALSRLFGGIGITILGACTTMETVGGYSAVYKIPFVMTMCFSPIGQALYPYMSRQLQENRRTALLRLRKLYVLVFGVFALGGAGVMLLHRPVVSLVLGDEYLSYSGLVFLLVPQALLSITNNFLGVQGLIAGGYQKEYSRCITVSMAVLIGANLLLCPAWGPFGTAAAALASELVLTLILVVHFGKIYLGGKNRK